MLNLGYLISLYWFCTLITVMLSQPFWDKVYELGLELSSEQLNLTVGRKKYCQNDKT